MPQPLDAVQSRRPRRVIFVRQHFTKFGGGELILDRMISAMVAAGTEIALLGRSWNGRKDIEFIACDPLRFPRFRRERIFAQRACDILSNLTGAIVQSHERIACCDIFRAGDGVHAAFLEQRSRNSKTLASAAFALHLFHRSVLALERAMFSSQRLKAVIANSDMVVEEIVRHFDFPRERIHLVPNGIDLSRFHPDSRDRYRTEVRNRLGTAPNRPVVLFAGSGFKRKGLDSAIAALAASRIDAELWVIGDDHRIRAYKSMAERAAIPAQRLRMLGPVADPLPYYAAADAFILPSIYDPFPSTVVEALACGLPVVTSMGCGARDVVARLDPALVADAGDTHRLANALTRAFEMAAKTSTTALARNIANDYSMERMIERTLAVHDRVRGES